MTTTLLISEAKLRQFTDINDNLDSALIKNGVREAQDIELQRILGTKLYDQVISYVNSGTVPAAYQTLLDDYIQDFLLYAAYYEVLEAIYIRPRNNGLLTPSGGENSSSVDRTMYDVKRQSVKNKKEFYGEILVNYLIENQSTFPLINESTLLYQLIADRGVQFRSPIVFKYDTYAPHLKEMVKAGIKIYDSRYPYLPQ